MAQRDPIAPETSVPSQGVADQFGRALRKLRISVTDRCNFRCTYCMPRESYAWLPKDELLTFDEIARLTRVMAGLGVQRLRITGGEPLLRRDLPLLVARLARIEGIRSVALTTNGMLLERDARALHDAGLQGVTVSLDTLRPDRFVELAGCDGLEAALAGLHAAAKAGFTRIKTNTVVMRGHNDDELGALIEHARSHRLEPRFIEYMDVGGAVQWRPELVVPRAEILRKIGELYGPLRRLRNRDGAPADRYALSNGFVLGVISSTTEPFCSACDRARLTADGLLLSCLYARTGLDLRAPLRQPQTDEQLHALLDRRWRGRSDRGAEARLATLQRGPLVSADTLVRQPHMEMHRRGG